MAKREKRCIIIPSQSPQVVISYDLEDGECALNDSRTEFFISQVDWANITFVNPDEIVSEEVLDNVDLYHQAKRRRETLESLERAERVGTETINSAKGARLVNDRVESLELFEELGLTTPEWDYGKADEVDVANPGVAKTRTETENGKHDIEFVEDEIAYEGERLVQEYIDHNRALKVYNVANQTLSVELHDNVNDGFVDPRDAAAEEVSSEEVKVPYENYDNISDVAQALRDETGLEMFELDFIKSEPDSFEESNDEMYALDINAVPYLADTEEGMDMYEEILKDKAYGSLK